MTLAAATWVLRRCPPVTHPAHHLNDGVLKTYHQGFGSPSATRDLGRTTAHPHLQHGLVKVVAAAGTEEGCRKPTETRRRSPAAMPVVCSLRWELAVDRAGPS